MTHWRRWGRWAWFLPSQIPVREESLKGLCAGQLPGGDFALGGAGRWSALVLGQTLQGGSSIGSHWARRAEYACLALSSTASADPPARSTAWWYACDSRSAPAPHPVRHPPRVKDKPGERGLGREVWGRV